MFDSLPVNHLSDVVAFSWDDADLMDILHTGFDTDGKHGGLNEIMLETLPAEGLDGVDEDVAAFGFVLVLGEFGASGERGRVCFIGFVCLKERLPVAI